jgi:hypothetical protein
MTWADARLCKRVCKVSRDEAADRRAALLPIMKRCARLVTLDYKSTLDTPIRDEPHQRDSRVQHPGDPRAYE